MRRPLSEHKLVEWFESLVKSHIPCKLFSFFHLPLLFLSQTMVRTVILASKELALRTSLLDPKPGAYPTQLPTKVIIVELDNNPLDVLNSPPNVVLLAMQAANVALDLFEFVINLHLKCSDRVFDPL